MKKICECCGKEFDAKQNNARFCSRYCCNKIYTQTDKYKKIKARRNNWRFIKARDFIYSFNKKIIKGGKKTDNNLCFKYTEEEFINHIQSLFKEGMSLNNHGIVWHIDHIKPLSSFKLIKEDGTFDYEQISLANSLDNLQPLFVKDNLKKGSVYFGSRYLKGENGDKK